ncbi:hypothetical protein EB796_008785 [Bugula neritina]|uniref:Uncharacterized protein n=1 Tax=Bugula neritina TaxID=10212 RepID=A0A7J7K2N1_BUGNE|nr:hypothetical protein EB796_008785 [Bugula neritina]
METTTTNREAYKGLRVTPASLIKPVNKSHGQGAFQGTTENKDSYTPKPIEHVTAYRLKDNNIMSGTFQGSSGYSENFVQRAVVKTKSFAPSYQYRKPSAKFSCETTNKKDFVAYKDVKKLPHSTVNSQNNWLEAQKAGTPMANAESTYRHDFPDGNIVGDRVSFEPRISTLKLGKENIEMSTNYKDDFTFKTQSKLKSYAPLPTFIKPGVKMDSSTESQERFKGVFQPPPKSFRPLYEINPNKPPMDTSTNYSSSFQRFQFVSDIPESSKSGMLPEIVSSRKASPTKKPATAQE